MLIKIKEKYKLYWPCIMAATLAAIYMYHISLFGDDNAFASVGGNPKDIVFWLIHRYQTWSSRLIIEGITIVVSQNKLVWSLFLGGGIFVSLFSICKIALKQPTYSVPLQGIICLLFSIYPWKELSNAGWIATLNNYFCPLAAGFFALVPIKKILLGEKISKFGYIVYAGALLYACNQELEMVFLGVVYFLFMVYFIIRGCFRKETAYRKFGFLMIQLILILLSAIFILQCPGLAARKAAESIRIPNFEQFSFLDKLDIGYSTTMYDIIFGSKLYIIFSCVLIAWLMCKKYDSTLYRIIALIPAVVTILFGPLRNLLYTFWPNLSFITANVSEEGLVTEGNFAFGAPFTQYLFISTVLLAFFLSMLLLLSDITDMVWSASIFLGGILSRIAMGFSPTIYASGTRTYSILGFAIIASVAMVVARGVEGEALLSQKEYQGLNIVMLFLGALSLLNIGNMIFIQ